MHGGNVKGAKRALAVLLAATLSVWCVPAGAFAQETGPQAGVQAAGAPVESVPADAADDAAHGVTGDAGAGDPAAAADEPMDAYDSSATEQPADGASQLGQSEQPASDAALLAGGAQAPGASASDAASGPVSDAPDASVLAAGVYEVCAAGDPSYALDVAGASLTSGANVRLWSGNSSQAQKWYIAPDAEGYFTLTSMASGLVLDVADGGREPGTNVWQCTPFGNSMQKWRLEKRADGSFTLFSKGNGLALDIADGICAAGTNVRTWTPNGATAQAFVLRPCDDALYADGTYELALSDDRGIDLDVCDASVESGANVQTHGANGTFAQKWHVTTRDDGFCTIESTCSGKLLAVSGGAGALGANVCQQTADGTDAQLWKLSPRPNGGYCIVSKDGDFAVAVSGHNAQLGAVEDAASFVLKQTQIIPEGYYTIGAYGNASVKLDVQDASRTSGANVQLHTENGSNAQVVEITANDDGSFTIAFPFSRKVLDVADGGTEPGTNVWQCTPFGNSAQKWYPKYAGDRSFSFVSKHNRALALDIADGRAESGTNVQVYTRNGTSAQRFVLTPTTYVPDDFADHMAHFSTVSTNTINGWYNMSRALSNFDGMVVYPGQTVSFFDTCGPCGAAEGYLIAGVVGGEGYGGGICQASTTLYGAVLRAGLTIVERQNHTKPSTYVPIGQDAMVNWGSSDFRFRNDWDFPVKIVVDCRDRTLNCDIWGIQPDWYDTVEISSWWTGSNSTAAVREYYKNGTLVHSSRLPSSWYW